MDQKMALSGGLTQHIPSPHGAIPLPPQVSSDRDSHPVNGPLDQAIAELNANALLRAMLSNVEKIPFKTKRAYGVTDNYKILEKLFSEMSKSLGFEFLHVDLKNSKMRDVALSDWESLSACHRSESGTIGIYFLQCGGSSAKPASIVVAKPMTLIEYELINFVDEFTTTIFGIQTPQKRLIDKRSENAEFAALETSMKKLFEPYHTDLYEGGSSDSPKLLFSSSHIMLMNLVPGKALCHRAEGQRVLVEEDWESIGRLFLLDLLLHNTDRLPCRRAIPRSGGVIAIENQGNPGNLMFGSAPGSLWSIDPEFKSAMDPARLTEYCDSVGAVVEEILKDLHLKTPYKAVNGLFFCPLPGLAGVLDTSLEALTPWSSLSELQKQAVDGILALIRIRAKADNGLITTRAGSPPPANGVEREWREWIRKAVPRAMVDVFYFVEHWTGFTIDYPSASLSFKKGFKESLRDASLFSELKFEKLGHWSSLIASITPSVDCSFITRVIKHIEKNDTRKKFQLAIKKSLTSAHRVEEDGR